MTEQLGLRDIAQYATEMLLLRGLALLASAISMTGQGAHTSRHIEGAALVFILHTRLGLPSQP